MAVQQKDFYSLENVKGVYVCGVGVEEGKEVWSGLSMMVRSTRLQLAAPLLRRRQGSIVLPSDSLASPIPASSLKLDPFCMAFSRCCRHAWHPRPSRLAYDSRAPEAAGPGFGGAMACFHLILSTQPQSIHASKRAGERRKHLKQVAQK